jgi:hypothetical protein
MATNHHGYDTKMIKVLVIAMSLLSVTAGAHAQEPAATPPPDDSAAKFIQQMAAKDQELAEAKRQLAAAKATATPGALDEQRARQALEFDLLFHAAEQSAAAESCEKRKGVFVVLVSNGQLLPLCQLKFRPPSKK